MRRTFISIFVLAGITVVGWVMVQLPPGDYVTDYVEQLIQQTGQQVTPEQEANLRAFYGVDKPQYVQFIKWIGRFFQGDFGTSFIYQRSVGSLIWERLPATVGLTAATILFTWTMGFPIGVYSAMRARTAGDYIWTFIGFIGLATPDFLLALILIWLWFVQFGEVLGGFFSFEYIEAPWSVAKFIDLIKHTWLAAVVLGTSGTAGLIRIMRNNLLDELYKPYVVTARSKGLKYWKAVFKYPVRIAFIPFASGIGGIFASLVSGSVIVSIVMDLQTVGPLLYEATVREDMFLAATSLIMLSALSIFGVLVSDLVLVFVDPRIRMEQAVEG
jgi:peptide/nickel transport system permease protein